MPDTGSGYGGKHTGEAALEAARLSKATGKTVKVVWTREEEFKWAYFRPAGVIEVKSAVNETDLLQPGNFTITTPDLPVFGTPYTVENQENRISPRRITVATRVLSCTGFYCQCFCAGMSDE